MSVYKHKRTGDIYSVIMTCFNVETQENQKVYISHKNGQIFSRNAIKFAENFELIEANPQSKIVRKEPHE